MKTLLNLYTSLLLVGFSIFLLWHLVLISVYGQVTIAEPRQWILVPELVIMVLVIMLGICKLFTIIKEG